MATDSLTLETCVEHTILSDKIKQVQVLLQMNVGVLQAYLQILRKYVVKYPIPEIVKTLIMHYTLANVHKITNMSIQEMFTDIGETPIGSFTQTQTVQDDVRLITGIYIRIWKNRKNLQQNKAVRQFLRMTKHHSIYNVFVCCQQEDAKIGDKIFSKSVDEIIRLLPKQQQNWYQSCTNMVKGLSL